MVHLDQPTAANFDVILCCGLCVIKSDGGQSLVDIRWACSMIKKMEIWIIYITASGQERLTGSGIRLYDTHSLVGE